MNKLNGQSMNVLEENVSKIKELFPEAFEEGKIDFDVLKKLLGSFVDKDAERYSFAWNGKNKAIKTALTPTSATLRPDRESSKNWDSTENIFIEGDNLEVLKVLQDTYRNKVKMIYIDPPYNTGHDFVYSDNFNDTVADYKERTNQAMVSNADTNGRYHTNWLNMMYPRLRLARNLLTDDGAIFISIDDNEVANLRKICDEIFGEENFIDNIVWDKKSSAKGVPPKNMMVNVHEYILAYQNGDGFKFVGEERTEESGKFKNPDNDPRGPWRESNIKSTIKSSDQAFTIIDPDTGREYTNTWAFSKESLEQMIKEKRILWKDSLPKQKEFMNEMRNENMAIKSNWGVFDPQSTTVFLKELIPDAKFDNPKPIRLMDYLIKVATKKNSIILDFFAGSGTTAHSIMNLNVEDGGNRKFVLVQIPEEVDVNSEVFKAGYKYISDISKERIRRAGEKIKADNKDKEGIDKLDIGFKAFTLDSTNLTLWDEKTQDLQTSLLEQINSTKNGRTQEDVLYEVLLKYGVDLATPITEESINGKKVYSIAGGYLLVCLDKDIDLETVSEIAKKKPERVVFYDHGFADDMVKINAEQTLKKAGIEDIRVI
ncbi:site-specific DNA-methyltransferase [Candidatus Gracilibacteria bacterium]|nr:site-specific DNA-methyltransferase [Candidatus Gracilibacteria bacterium]